MSGWIAALDRYRRVWTDPQSIATTINASQPEATVRSVCQTEPNRTERLDANAAQRNAGCGADTTQDYFRHDDVHIAEVRNRLCRCTVVECLLCILLLVLCQSCVRPKQGERGRHRTNSNNYRTVRYSYRERLSLSLICAEMNASICICLFVSRTVMDGMVGTTCRP
eukprot:jgi/Psemu1/302438/fgenesh1_kg.69_\